MSSRPFIHHSVVPDDTHRCRAGERWGSQAPPPCPHPSGASSCRALERAGLSPVSTAARPGARSWEVTGGHSDKEEGVLFPSAKCPQCVPSPGRGNVSRCWHLPPEQEARGGRARLAASSWIVHGNSESLSPVCKMGIGILSSSLPPPPHF